MIKGNCSKWPKERAKMLANGCSGPTGDEIYIGTGTCRKRFLPSGNLLV